MRRFVLVLVIAALAGGGLWLASGRQADRTPPDGGPRTARVVRGTLVDSVSATGTLQPYAKVEVRSRATGAVVRLAVQEGARVARGQLLAVIDDVDAEAGYRTSQAQLAQAQARLQQARSQLASTRAQNVARVAQADSALATARARLRQVAAGARPEEVQQAREARRQAELAADLARQSLERTRQLFADGLVARTQLEQAQHEYEVAQAQLRAAQARVQQLEAGSRPEEVAVAQAQVREAEQAVAQARAARAQEAVLAAEVSAAASAVANAQAQVAQARQRLAETRLTAPIAGIVAQLLVQEGQSVIGGLTGGGTHMMTIADTRVIQANVNVDESDVARIRRGMLVRLVADALPGRTFTGRVERIAPQSVVVQNVTQYVVVVNLDRADPDLRLGMTVDAEFVVMERRDVLLVPAEAVRGKDATVVILVEGEVLTPVVVKTGATDGRQIEIVEGLRAGQVVYLGPSRPGGAARPQQPVNPFMPQFRRSTPAGPRR